jgi:Na+-driven multidrug efflux pump
MIDMVFISSYIGVNGVTVLGFISPLTMFFEVIGSAVANGARNMVSSMIGAGKLDDANRVFSDSLIMSGGLSILLALLSFVFCPGLARILGAVDPEIAEMTQQYILGYIIGFPFYTLTRVITPYLQIEGQYNRVNLTSILTTVIDIVGDVLVVFVMLGSMFEIGLATAIGYIIPFFVSAAYFMRKKNSHVFQLKIKGFSPKLCIKMFQLGAPMGITKGSKALGGLIINNMLTALTCRFSLRHTVFFLKSRCLYARRGTHRPIRSWRLPAFS